MPQIDNEDELKAHDLDVIRGKRLKKLRSIAGLTSADLAKKAGVTRTSIFYWEKASKSGGLSEKGAHRVISALREENVDCSFEWLWEGKGSEPRRLKVEEKKPAGDTVRTGRLVPSMEKEIDVFLDMNKDAVIVKIDTIQLRPAFEFGDLVAGKWQPVDALRTEGYCIVNIDNTDQVRWVKKIDSKNSNCTVQLSYSPFSKHHEIEEIQLNVVAPIIRLWR